MFEKIKYTKQFKKDYKKVIKRDHDIDKLDGVMELLAKGEQLSEEFSDHKLVGNWRDCRELHIEPDWLLIYRIRDDVLEFVRTGSHSDIFAA